MKSSKILRVLVGAVLVMVGAGVAWWVVGYTLGKAILSETGGGVAFRAAWGFRDAEVARILFLALLASVVRLLPLGGSDRWLRLAGVAGVAAIVGGAGAQDGVTIALFVLAAAAVAEAHAVEALLVALAAGAVVALAAVLGTGLDTGHKLLAIALLDAFLYVPLLFGPELVDSALWKARD